MKISLLAVKKGCPTGSSEGYISFSILCSTMIKFMQKFQKFNFRTCGKEGLGSHPLFKITRTKAQWQYLCFLLSIPFVLLNIQNCWTSDVRYYICTLKKKLFIDLMSMNLISVCYFSVILLMVVCFRSLVSVCGYVPSTHFICCSSEQQKYLPFLDSCDCMCHPCVMMKVLYSETLLILRYV